MSLETTFQEAVARSQQFSQRPSNEELLELYALFKQATEGDVQGERPGGFDFRAIAKYQAWEEKKGTSKSAAMDAYVQLVERLAKNYG